LVVAPRPGHIQAISVSLTEKGISNKDILISLASGGLLELPRMLLDPRRPVEPRPQDREEGLIPYTPELPIPTIGECLSGAWAWEFRADYDYCQTLKIDHFCT
jgi:hypothetical protein